MPNRKLGPLPLSREVVNPNRKLTTEFERWLNDLDYLISTRSFQTISAANTINVSAKHVSLQETVGNYAVVLPAPTVSNVDLVIEMTARAAGNVTIALTNVVGGTAGTTATFDDVGETLILKSNNTKWVVVKEFGVTLS
jgi:hypothetical protein